MQMFGRTVIYTDALSVYNASIYQITATFEADVRRDGMIFRPAMKSQGVNQR